MTRPTTRWACLVATLLLAIPVSAGAVSLEKLKERQAQRERQLAEELDLGSLDDPADDGQPCDGILILGVCSTGQAGPDRSTTAGQSSGSRNQEEGNTWIPDVTREAMEAEAQRTGFRPEAVETDPGTYRGGGG